MKGKDTLTKPTSAGCDLSIRLFGKEISYEDFIYRITDDIINNLMKPIEKSGEDNVEKEMELPESSSEESETFNGERNEKNDKWSRIMDSIKSKMGLIVGKILNLNLKKSIDFDWTKNTNIINLKYKIPSNFGFPLKISLNASSYIDIKVNGDFDIKDLTHFDISGKVLPRYM